MTPFGQDPGLTFLARDASKSYQTAHGVREVFDRLTVEYQENTTLGVMGPNGCGKSTLLRCLIGRERLDRGTFGLTLDDRDLLAVVEQGYDQQVAGGGKGRQRPSSITVEQNLLLPVGGERDPGFDRRELADRFQNLLTRMGYQVGLRTPVGTLSGGELQAVVLARSLAYQPRILIWDEPTSAIDYGKRGSIYRLLDELRSVSRISMVLVTHAVEEVLLAADRVILFASGMRVVADTPIHRPVGCDAYEFLDSPEANRVRRLVWGAMLGGRSCPASNA